MESVRSYATQNHQGSHQEADGRNGSLGAPCSKDDRLLTEASLA